MLKPMPQAVVYALLKANYSVARADGTNDLVFIERFGVGIILQILKTFGSCCFSSSRDLGIDAGALWIRS